MLLRTDVSRFTNDHRLRGDRHHIGLIQRNHQELSESKGYKDIKEFTHQVCQGLHGQLGLRKHFGRHYSTGIRRYKG